MASAALATEIAKLEDPSTPPQEMLSGYLTALSFVVASSDHSQLPLNLAAIIDSILRDSLSVITLRPLLGRYVEALRKIDNADTRIHAGQHALQALQTRVVSFEEQDAQLREILADAYQEQEHYLEAAKVLQGMQLESSQRSVSDSSKVRVWVRICRLYLEEDDTTSAESYLNRAKGLLYKVNDNELNLMFQLSQARILDARHKFLDASQVYHSVSLSPSLDKEDRNRALSSAIKCAVLAPAGPRRSRSLGKLFQADRTVELEEFSILEKMFLDRLISPTEVEHFAGKLDSHQRAQTADGLTVIGKATIEHNLIGASRLYTSIGVDELSSLLGLEAEDTERYAAQMLEQGRLTGWIDQIEGIIFFGPYEGNGGRSDASQASMISAMTLKSWDGHVQMLTEEVERISSLIQSYYPSLLDAGI